MDQEHHVQRSKNGAIIVKSQNGFSTLYRLVDISIITFLFLFVTGFSHESVTTENLLIVCTYIILFQLSAEGMELYRSWRGFRTPELLRAAAITWLLSLLGAFTLGFLFSPKIDIAPMLILCWLAICFFALLTWRFIMRKFLFHLRMVSPPEL